MDADLTVGGVGPSAELRRRQARRAMRMMALALGIDVERPEYLDPQSGAGTLWEEIKARVAGGKMTSPHSEAPPIGDGFAIFVRGTCHNPEHRIPVEFTLVHKCRGGLAYDEHEAREVMAYLKDEHPECEECGEPVTSWSCEMNRLSVYAEAEKQRTGQ